MAFRVLGKRRGPKDDLTFGQRVLTNPFVGGAIDIVSGGQSLSEAEEKRSEALESITTLPSDLAKTAGFVATAPSVIARDVRTGLQDRSLENITERSKGTLRVLGRVLHPFSVAIEGTRAALGAAVDRKPAGEIAQAGIRGALRPEEVQTLMSKIPLTKFEREGGTARLIPRAIAEALETIAIAEVSLGGAVSRIKGQLNRNQLSRVESNLQDKINAAKLRFEGPGVIGKGTDDLKDLINKVTPKDIISAARRDVKFGNIVAKAIAEESIGARLAKTLRSQLGQKRSLAKGDIVKLGGQIGRIVNSGGSKAIVQIGGKNIRASLNDIKDIRNEEDIAVAKDLSDLIASSEAPLLIRQEEGFTRLGSGQQPFVSEIGPKKSTEILDKFAEGKQLTTSEAEKLDFLISSFKEAQGIEGPSEASLETIEKVSAVEKIEPKLRVLGRGEVKKEVRKATGQIVPKGKPLTEKAALKGSLKRQQAVSKEVFRSGQESGKAKVRDVLIPRAAKGEARLKSRLERLKRQEELGLLKEDIRRRSELTKLKKFFRDKEARAKADKNIREHIKKRMKFIKGAVTKDMPLEFKDLIEEIKTGIQFDKVRLINILKRTKDRAKLGVDVQLKEKISDLEKINPANMTVDELDEVFDVIQQLVHTGSMAGKFIKIQNQKSLSESVLEGVKTINKSNVVDLPPIDRHLKDQWAKKPKEVKEKFIAEHRRPEAIFEQLDGFVQGANYNTGFKPMVKADASYLRGLEARVSELSEIYEKIDISKASGKKEVVKGFNVRLTRDNMMFIAANARHPQNKAHLIASGVSEEMIANVIQKLTPSEVKAIDRSFQYLAELWPELDKVYSNIKGVHLRKVKEDYFPIMNVENVGDLEAIEMNISMLNDYIATGVPQNFAKDRAPISEKAFTRYSFFENMYRYTRQTEYYKAFAETVRDVSLYMKHPLISKSIRRNLGESIYSVLTSWLDDVARGSEKRSHKFLDNISMGLRTNFVVSVLGANLSTVTKQHVSFVQGMGVIGEKAAMDGLIEFIFKMGPNKAIAFVNGKSTQMKNRAFSQERELQEMMRGRGVAKIFGQGFLKSPDFKKFRQVVREGSMVPILLADRATVTSLWIGAYKKRMSETLGNEQASRDWADSIIRRTQPQSGLIHLPSIFKEGPFIKLLTVFRNQPNQNWNLIYDTFIEFGGNPKDQAAFFKFSRSTWYYLMFGSLLFGFVSRKRLPKSIGEIASDLVQQTVGGLVLLSDVVNKVKYPWGSSGLLDGVYDDASRLFTSKRGPTKAKYLGRLIGKLKGIPGYTSIERLFIRESIKTKLLGGEKEKTGRVIR
jgi:hypothetical protein